ncbi:hypothetical protein OS493_010373 [Desmophyllum pertusum]|uniref:RING-type domain-containing protein n=1 Tax=Desmophyllum pertusum TaxID=174260 RepID=A0A9X0A470_9CNID|nr:hypothetical protein OS493_010373 [Desmophyllum pertusum]
MAKASSLADNLAKELECAVCLEQYKEPKVLPCLHSFCKTCLGGLLNKQGEVWRINCPACRLSVEIPQGDIESLPANFFLNNLLSMVALHGDSDRSNLECDICDSGDPPVNRCTTCCHFLCNFCTAGHKRGRSTKLIVCYRLKKPKKRDQLLLHAQPFAKNMKERCSSSFARHVMKLFVEIALLSSIAITSILLSRMSLQREKTV